MSQQLVTFLASLLGSGVEAVEALTIVLAVGLTRGWRAPLAGSAVAFIVLAVLVAVFSLLSARVSDAALKTVVGVLILLFGLRWLHKGVLRSGGVIALHDEAAAFAKTVETVRRGGVTGGDRAGFLLAFQGVLLEGIEVVFIVVAVGSGSGGLAVAALGAVVAVLLVAAAGAAVRHPLAAVPENTLKLAVGVALATMGTFWTAEGLGAAWPGDAVSLLPLALLYLVGTRAAVYLVRRVAAAPSRLAA